MGRTTVHSLFKTSCIFITIALAGLTLIAGHSGTTAPADSVFMPLAGLLLPVLLILCLLTGMGWMWARSRWAAVPLIAFLGCWDYLGATVRLGSSPDSTPGATHLKVATYNVARFGRELTGYSCRLIAERMQAEKVDVVLFQEFGSNHAFTTDSLRQALSHWQYCYLPHECDSLRHLLPLAIFSRYPLTGCHPVVFAGTANSAAVCDVVLPADTLRLFNCHLQTTHISQKRRTWQRELDANETRRDLLVMQDASLTLHGNFVRRQGQTAVLDSLVRLSPHPVILGGDLNSLPSSHTYHTLTACLSDGFREAGSGYIYTYRHAKHLLRIDYLLHSPTLRTLSYHSPDWKLCSDHNPVVMEVEWQ